MPRSEDIKQERRRRDTGALSGRNKKLSVDESSIDRTKFAYRFINDTGSRVHDLTVRDDWDVVDAKDARLVGEGERGDAIKAVLVKKPLNYYSDDKAAEQRQIDEQEKAIQKGAAPGGDAEGQYIPQGGIKMTN